MLHEGLQVEEGPLLVDLPPVAWLQPPAFGDSLPSVVEWLPVTPHDLLLVSAYSLYAARLVQTAPDSPSAPDCSIQRQA